MKLIVTKSNLSEMISSHPEIIKILHTYFVKNIFLGFICLIFGFFLLFRVFLIGIILVLLTIYFFYKSYQYHLAYTDARNINWNQTKHMPPNIKQPSIHSKTYMEYGQIYRQGTSNNNLNYDEYIFSGKYIETNRIRTKKNIIIFPDQDTKKEIMKLGYTDPIEYCLAQSYPASENQLAYLRDLTKNHIPRNLSVRDASALISRIVDHDNIPNPQLFEFATQMHIEVSYYTGKKSLYNIIFDKLDTIDRIAFFSFCVYKYLSKDYTVANMNNCKYKNTFYEFANSVKDDSSFLKSMNNYKGKELRFFGSRTINGYITYGGSKNTIAYKRAKQFIETKILS